MKKVKKASLFILITLIVINLTQCNEVFNSKDNIEEIKIGITVYKEDDKFISNIIKNIEEIAKEKQEELNLKVVINVQYAKGSLINQSNQVDKFIEQDFDVICINIVDRTAAATIIDKGKNADVPIIFFNREPVEEDLYMWDKVYYVGANSEQSGELQGNVIVDIFNKDKKQIDKNNDGKIQYVMLEGEHGHQDTSIRTEYSIKTLVENNIEVEKLDNATGNWEFNQGNEKMTEWINEFGQDIEVVFSNNDEMALGAIESIKNSEIKINPIVVSIDGIEEALNAVKIGDLEATVVTDSKKQAEWIFDLSYDLAKGEEIDLKYEKYIKVEHITVSSKNIDLYIK